MVCNSRVICCHCRLSILPSVMGDTRAQSTPQAMWGRHPNPRATPTWTPCPAPRSPRGRTKSPSLSPTPSLRRLVNEMSMIQTTWTRTPMWCGQVLWSVMATPVGSTLGVAPPPASSLPGRPETQDRSRRRADCRQPSFHQAAHVCTHNDSHGDLDKNLYFIIYLQIHYGHIGMKPFILTIPMPIMAMDRSATVNHDHL